jgi:hypothetical protein
LVDNDRSRPRACSIGHFPDQMEEENEQMQQMWQTHTKYLPHMHTSTVPRM